MNAALNHLVSVLATGGTHLGDLCFWSLAEASIVRSDLESKWKSSGLAPELLPEPPTVEKAFKLAVRETQVGLGDRLIRPVIDNEASVVFAVVHEQKHDDGTLSYTQEAKAMASVYRKQNRWWIHFKDGTGRWRDISTTVDTKSSAKAIARELDHKAERQRLGLEAIPKARKRVTLGEVMDLWWSEYGQKLRSTTINLFAEKHLRKGLGKLALADLRPGRIETFLNEKKDELAPRSVNHLRSHLRRLFNIAIKKELWSGTNPIAEVEKADVPKRLPDYLRTEEVPLVLAELEPEWRPLFATAIHTAGRRGELFALRREDVDIKARTITFARSLDSDTTKGGHADLLPIADELVPYLEQALHESKSDLVFPSATGKPQRHDTKLQKTLRRAMANAGLVVAFSHSCRTKKCGHRERRRDDTPAACPRCGKTLFSKGIPRPVRFHDLRHTTATLMLKAGVPLATVQRILRHTDPAITSEIYGHLDLDDMRAAVNHLSFAPKLKVVS